MKKALVIDSRIAVSILMLFLVLTPFTKNFYLIALVFFLVLLFCLRGMHELQTSTDAIILKFWNCYRVMYGPGFYTTFPWYTQKIRYSTGGVTHQTPYVYTTDREGKSLYVSILLELKIKDPLVCSEFRLEKMSVLIDSTFEDIFRTQTPKYQFEHFISEDVKQMLLGIVNTRISVINLVVHDFYITQLR